MIIHWRLAFVVNSFGTPLSIAWFTVHPVTYTRTIFVFSFSVTVNNITNNLAHATTVVALSSAKEFSYVRTNTRQCDETMCSININ